MGLAAGTAVAVQRDLRCTDPIVDRLFSHLTQYERLGDNHTPSCYILVAAVVDEEEIFRDNRLNAKNMVQYRGHYTCFHSYLMERSIGCVCLWNHTLRRMYVRA
jgi:hypothetical protein